ncbi:MAG: DUF3367 domain-containing protein, partial [Acidimicrobiales bacterium]|nr:DUF3367 domain-containing protein [Acidimicrobiales bacterium]
GAALKALLESEYGLAMRSLPRATPLVALALAVFVGALIASLTANAPRLARPLTAGAVVLAVLGLPPLWRLQMVDANLDRAEDLPDYWIEAAAAIDARGEGTRVLEVPGTDFASYRWGNTVDPVLPGLIDRPYVARELIPYGSAASANLLDAFDHRMQEGTLDAEAIVPLARFMGAGDISVRSDLTYERYNTPRPRLLWELLMSASGLSFVEGFGPGARNTPRPDLPMVDETELQTPPELADPPEVGLLEVDDAEQIVRTSPLSDTVVVAGDGAALVDSAAAGLLTGHESLVYSASYAGDPQALEDLAGDEAPLVITDTNRRAGQRWGTLRDNHGRTERAGEEALRHDAKDQRLPVFPDAGDDAFTVIESRGDVRASATSYGNTVTFTAEDRAAMAVDGQTGTAWRTGGFSPATDETLRLEFAEPVTTDQIRLLQVVTSVRNRHITRVTLTFDDDETLAVDLTDESRPDELGADDDAGQVVEFGERTFSQLDITIDETVPGKLPRYDGLSSVGFAEVTVIDDQGRHRLADDVVRLPTDLFDTITETLTHPLAVVLTRLRVPGSVAVRTSPETSITRTFTVPDDRAYALTGTIRLSPAALEDSVLDSALGLPLADRGGITVTSRRRLPGGIENRASAAIDGDPDTWYSPGYLGQNGEWIDVDSAVPFTFDHLDLTVLNDGRHSVPRRVRLEVDGQYHPDLVFTLPEIGDQDEPNARHTFQIELPRSITANRIRFVVEESPEDPTASVREVTTLDWYSGDEIVMPIGIVDLGIDGLQIAQPPAAVPSGCRDDLFEVDGRPISVALSGTSADLRAGGTARLTTCGGAPLVLPSGEVTVRTTDGALTGFDIDQLVLRSAAGGAAEPAAGPMVDGALSEQRPSATIVDETRTSLSVDLGERSEPTWLILGQSHNLGWTASVDGTDLGEPVLVNGFANGWLIPAGQAARVEMRWTPQRVVNIALGTTVVGVALTLFLALRRPRTAATSPADDPTWVPLDRRPSMPQAFSMDRIRRFAGPQPSRFAVVLTVPATLVLGWAFIGPPAGLVLALAAAVCLRVRRARPILTVGGLVVFAGCVGWVVVQQLFREFPSGFDWPTYFEAVHRPTLLAIGLLLLDPIVERCWLRRWWPSEDSPR